MESNFTKWLADQMAKNDWNKTSLSELVKVTISTVTSWQDGDGEPRPDKLIRLAEITGENPYLLFHWVYGLPLPESVNTKEPTNLRPKEKEILNRLHNVNENGLDLLIDQITHVLTPRFAREKVPNGRENR